MIPLHLSLSGFLSYQDHVEIDFTQFDLACISGQNGAGKSSLLDAITWALFGQARKRDDSLINTYCNAADITLDFAYEGAVYRIQRSKAREKPTMLEFRIQTADNGWKPLTERTLLDTEKRIRQTLRMDYETFINASFFLQGKADQFAQQRPGDRKRILSSILGLEVWETYREATADRRKALEQEVSTLDGRLREIAAELSEEAQRKARLAELQTSLEQIAATCQVQETAVAAMHSLKASLDEQKKMVETQGRYLQQALQALTGLTERLETRRVERSNHLQVVANAGEIRQTYAAWQAARQDLERWETIAAQFREQEKKRQAPLLEIESARSLLEKEQQDMTALAEEIKTGLVEKETKQRQLEQAQMGLAQARQRLERRLEVDGLLRTLHQERADARAENPRLKAEMDELKERIEQLQETTGGDCPTCGQPLTAEHRQTLIDELTTYGKSLGERFRQNQALLKDFEERVRLMEKELASLVSAEKDVLAQTRTVDQIEQRLKQIDQQTVEWETVGAPRQAEITRSLQDKDYAPEATARLAQIDLELKALGYDAAAHDAARRAETAGRVSEASLRRLEAAQAALEPIEREIGELEKQAENQSKEAAQQQEVFDQVQASYAAAAASLPDVGQAERELLKAREDEGRLRMEVGAARQKVAVLDDLRQRRRDLDERREELTLQISRHKTLERAFSKDGVPALLIEQALPEIESQANTLLDRLSGGAMSVRFATQKEYKDKNRLDLKETLDIVISDGAGTRDYEMFSGGEAFRVNFAIRLALSRVLAQRAGARLQTLVIDEGFGSQDAEGRQRLIEAINQIKPDFAKILVITHLEELKDAFPTRVEVEKTPKGSTVAVI